MPLFVTADERRALEQVRERPADDTARLVLADMLQSRGEAFGELIALQVRLSAADINWDTWAWNQAGGAFGARDWPLGRLLEAVQRGERDPGPVPRETVAMKARLISLETSASRWLRDLFPVPVMNVTWRRGLPADVDVAAVSLLATSAPLEFPIEQLAVSDVASDPGVVLAHAWARDAVRVSLTAPQALTRPTPWTHGLPRLRGLALRSAGPMQEGTLAEIIASDALATVEVLSVPAMEWSDADEAAIRSLASLVTLDLDPPPFVDQRPRPVPVGLRALFDRPAFQRVVIEDLELTNRDRFERFVEECPTWLDVAVTLVERQAMGRPAEGPRRLGFPGPWRRFFK